MSTIDSPLFEPVVWQGGGFKILNELELPDRVEYLEAHEILDAVAAVRDMKTRAFGQVLTFFYSGALLAERSIGVDMEALAERVACMTAEFCDARPTFDFKGLGAILLGLIEKTPKHVEPGEWLAEQARGFARHISRARQVRAKRAAQILPQDARVMTHCNVSGELVAIAQFCKEMGKEFSVVATETRPYLQGTRLTAWELGQAGVAVSLVPDCAIAQVMARGAVNAVIVGADRVARNGDVINKVGTYPLALMAHDYGIPFYTLAQDPRETKRGSEVRIEERPAAELLMFQGHSLVANDRVKVRYPAFDVTPARLITRWIAMDDVYTEESLRQKFPSGAPAQGTEVRRDGKYLLVYGVPSDKSYDLIKTALATHTVESILVPEMRPELWGARVIARELIARGLPVTLISDNMMGTLFAGGEIRRLYLFYTQRRETGVEGICGSLLAAHLAELHRVPIELHEASLRKDAADLDVASFLGRIIIPAGATVYPLQAEIVPWKFVENSGRHR